MRNSSFWNLGAGVVLVLAFNVVLARGTTIERRGTAGCGKSHKVDGRSREFDIPSSGGNRTYRIHLPMSYNANVPAPLSVSYHGSTRTAADQETTSGLSDDSVNPNMIAVYPQGHHNHWEGAPYSTCGVDDKLFTTDLLNHLKDNYCIDEQRIYASGLSNGGGFVDVLACSEYGADFAAFAPVAGAYYKDVTDKSACHPSHALTPILEFHGYDDKRIPYPGGTGEKGAPLPAITDWASRWAVRDGCPNPPEAVQQDFMDETDSFVAYSVFTYSCGDAENIVTHFALNNTQHVWPTIHNSSINATPLIIDFFNMHTLSGREEYNRDHAQVALSADQGRK